MCRARQYGLSASRSLGSRERPNRGGRFGRAIVATPAALIVFLLVQGLLAAYNLGVVRDPVDRGWLDVSRRDPLLDTFLPLVYGGVSYVTLAFVGSVIGS
ncbi:MAG: hypothetical protein M3138_04010 [Actinomycetota bacterium]|nr:hypothetical protein [Actinomycetota bacterium]